MRHERQRGRDRADAQRAAQPRAQFRQAVLQRLRIGQDAPGVRQHEFAFGRQPDETPTALDDHDSEFGFELRDRGRQRRLGNAAGVGGAPEVPLARQRIQIDELPDYHPLIPGLRPGAGARTSHLSARGFAFATSVSMAL